MNNAVESVSNANAAIEITNVVSTMVEETKLITADDKIELVKMDLIDVSGYNPRKKFDEEDLIDLANSVALQGIMQPILLRPKSDNRFEIVFGERRFRAFELLGNTEIPAVVKELSDDMCRELAIAENVHRSNLSILEEARAYKEIYDRHKGDMNELVSRTGMKLAYLKGMLRLNDLIPEMAELLGEEKITKGIADEIAKYTTEIQQDIFINHFADEPTMTSWRQIEVKELRRILKDAYTTDLNAFCFDMSECKNCPKNSNHCLFPPDDPQDLGTCLDQSCLWQHNFDYVKDRVLEIIHSEPQTIIAAGYNLADRSVVDILEEMGYTIEEMQHPSCYMTGPEIPALPLAEDFDSVEDFDQAQVIYKNSYADYERLCKELSEEISYGSIRKIVSIEEHDIDFYYEQVDTEESESVDGASENTTEVDSDRPKTKRELNEPLILGIKSRLGELTHKRNRNDELKFEKIVEDTRSLLRKKRIKTKDFHPEEEKIFFRIIADNVRKENFTKLGIPKEQDKITPEIKKKVVSKLTEKRKTIIIRDFISKNIVEQLNTDEKMEMLVDFAKIHVPETVIEIENKYEESYRTRNAKLEEEIKQYNHELSVLEREIELELKEQELKQKEIEQVSAVEEDTETLPDIEKFIDETDPEEDVIITEPEVPIETANADHECSVDPETESETVIPEIVESPAESEENKTLKSDEDYPVSDEIAKGNKKGKKSKKNKQKNAA